MPLRLSTVQEASSGLDQAPNSMVMEDSVTCFDDLSKVNVSAAGMLY